MTTSAGGIVALDDPLFALWEAAPARILGQLAAFPPHDDLRGIVAESLACLAEAGLLDREPAVPRPQVTARGLPSTPLVHAVVVVSSVQELEWLGECVTSIGRQSFRPAHTVVVDNAAGVDVARWLEARALEARVVALRARRSYAAALSAAIDGRGADFYLLMNADVRLQEAALANLVAAALDNHRVAAVAPKLRFRRAPAFLNGLGNRVPLSGWGTDNGIGQVDLGQFDRWQDVPSGCLTALLVSDRAWHDVGPFDGGYPAYYEDVDWAYRARLLGYRIAAAPDAEVLHVFGASWTPMDSPGLTSAKLRAATIGRIRFICKVPGDMHRRVMLWNAVWEDVQNYRHAGRLNDRETQHLYRQVWVETWRARRELAAMHRELQARRRVRDDELFPPETAMPPSMMWGNVPELTCTAVRGWYAPLIRSGRTRAMPELSVLQPHSAAQR